MSQVVVVTRNVTSAQFLRASGGGWGPWKLLADDVRLLVLELACQGL